MSSRAAMATGHELPTPPYSVETNKAGEIQPLHRVHPSLISSRIETPAEWPFSDLPALFV